MKNTEEKDRQHGIEKEDLAQSADNKSRKKPQTKEEKEWQEKAEEYLKKKLMILNHKNWAVKTTKTVSKSHYPKIGSCSGTAHGRHTHY